MPDGFQQIGMSILKQFHLVLGILKTVKGKQLLQGACLKQMATSQLTVKVPSQVQGLLIKRERGRKDGRISKPEASQAPDPRRSIGLDRIAGKVGEKKGLEGRLNALSKKLAF